MQKNILMIMLLVVFTSSCAASESNRLKLSNSFFKPSNGVEKLHIVGSVKHLGTSEFDKAECTRNEVCLNEPKWNIYEINGYFLPDGEDGDSILVAHKYGAALITENSWLATLERINDKQLQEKIGADYLLVGVELGLNVFCSSDDNANLFKKMKPDFKRQNKKCYLI